MCLHELFRQVLFVRAFLGHGLLVCLQFLCLAIDCDQHVCAVCVVARCVLDCVVFGVGGCCLAFYLFFALLFV